MRCGIPLTSSKLISIEFVSSDKNIWAGFSVLTAALQPSESFEHGRCTMEALLRPSIHDNVEQLQVFNDDAQILHFMHSAEEFSKGANQL